MSILGKIHKHVRHAGNEIESAHKRVAKEIEGAGNGAANIVEAAGDHAVRLGANNHFVGMPFELAAASIRLGTHLEADMLQLQGDLINDALHLDWRHGSKGLKGSKDAGDAGGAGGAGGAGESDDASGPPNPPPS